ncbi:olfactory receptor 11G2-like [Varanus komodoensis]|uniref:olfactory receptor 11G2-like n=1 Tax=Varanus komodoensis TaxID=61221 RepID=UPI001CF7B01D|nr:olfactory receptor 11G2-like [Varanus komodoensis]
MELANGSAVQEFVLLGFGGGPQKQFLLLIFFTVIYMLSLAENIFIITLVFLDAHLSQIPMYILLSNFSWLEVCYVSTSVPRMLFDLASSNGIISFQACFFQFYVVFSLGNTEFFFLSAMAFDRYLAICHPLRYLQIMSPTFCYCLVAACWVLGFLGYIIPVTVISKLSFCGPNVIDHFVCDPGPILSLVCPPIGNAALIFQVFLNALFLGNVLFVVLSYGIVIFTLLKSSKPGNRKKAFSTISMHLMVVTLFYGSVGGMYCIPSGENQSALTKAITVFYSIITPFLNPLIYSLRNDQVKEALGRLLKRRARGWNEWEESKRKLEGK